MVVGHGHEHIGVRVPAEIQPEIPAVKCGQFLPGDGPQGQVVKDGGAVAHHLPQVLVGIGHRVPLLQQLRFVQEALSQPLGRGGQIGGVVPELLRLGLPLVPVDPVPCHRWAIEGLERKGKRPAAKHRLLDIAHFFGAVVLVELLKVQSAEIPEGGRHTLELAGVVQTEKLDGLSRGGVRQGEGLAALLPEVPHPHPVNDPIVLGPDRCGQGSAHLSQHHSVDVGGAHDQQDVLGGGEGAFQAAAAAVAQVLVVLARPDGPMGRVVLRYDQAGQPDFPPGAGLRGLPPGCHPQTPPFRPGRASRGDRTSGPGRGSSRKNKWPPDPRSVPF